MRKNDLPFARIKIVKLKGQDRFRQNYATVQRQQKAGIDLKVLMVLKNKVRSGYHSCFVSNPKRNYDKLERWTEGETGQRASRRRIPDDALISKIENASCGKKAFVNLISNSPFPNLFKQKVSV